MSYQGIGLGLGGPPALRFGSHISKARLLLDKVPGAELLLMPSLRLSREIVNSVELRRTSDNDEQEFSPEQWQASDVVTFADGFDARTTKLFDFSGNGNDATQTTAGAQPFAVTGGVLEDGIRFAPTQFLDTGSTNVGNGLFASPTTPFTVSVWIKAATSTFLRDFLARSGATAATSHFRMFITQSTVTDPNCFGFWLRGSSTRSSVVAADETWKLVTVRWDGTEARFFVNENIQTGALDVGTEPNLESATARIGTRGDGVFPYTGNIAFVGIWPRALSAAEIETVYKLTDPRPLIAKRAFENYLARVEDAGGEVLAPNAINTYFEGLVNNGIWDKLGSSCLFAGVDFDGCFVPIRDDMPTPDNINFDEDDHNVLTGLKGDGATKFILTNFTHANVDPANCLFSCYVTEENTSRNDAYFGVGTATNGATQLLHGSASELIRVRAQSITIDDLLSANTVEGFCSISRNSLTEYEARVNSDVVTVERDSETPTDDPFRIFARGIATASNLGPCRLTTYLFSEFADSLVLKNLQDQLLTDIANELS